jgi:hypothetical protein
MLAAQQAGLGLVIRILADRLVAGHEVDRFLAALLGGSA